jgi:hypothetical protein
LWIDKARRWKTKLSASRPALVRLFQQHAGAGEVAVVDAHLRLFEQLLGVQVHRLGVGAAVVGEHRGHGRQRLGSRLAGHRGKGRQRFLVQRLLVHRWAQRG